MSAREQAEFFYDLFRSAPVACVVNGEKGKSAFFSRDAQLAQATLVLQAREAECQGLRRALTKILNAAESWHRDTGHEDDDPIVKCDAICECIPIMRSALSGKPTEGK